MDRYQGHLPMNRLRRRAGFTLMELMIVVVIIGLLAAIVIPNLLSFMEKKRAGGEPAAPAAVEADRPDNPAPAPAGRPAEPSAVAPETEAADIRIRLSASSYIRRLKVYTLFNADFKGAYTFVGSGGDADRVRLWFPFPRSATQAMNVSLEIARNGGTFYEPDDAVYSLDGIQWSGELGAGERLTARVAYSAQGADRYVYEGPGSSRAGSLKIVMTLEGLTSEFIPADSLQPTRIEDDRLIWDFENLITRRRIAVELPGTLSPTGRAILFLRLAGLAVLLFGLGFIYLNDLKEPGRLDSFRWGHFLLLALTYSLFFIIFTALHLGQHLSAWVALLVSAILSLPLLMIHVSRFWGAGFAVFWILPLAVFTLAIVVNGVYGGAYKTYIYLGLTVLAAAFFTFTYRAWAENRKAFLAEKERRQQAVRAEALEEEENRKKEARRRAWRKSRIEKAGAAVDRLEEAWRRAENLMTEAELLLAHGEMPGEADLQEALKKAIVDIAGQEDPIAEMRSEAARLAEIAEDEALAAAVTELRSSAEHRRRRIQYAADDLSDAVSGLKKRRERKKAEDLRAANTIHCLACGAGYPLSNFCPHCGVRSPEKLTCTRCGETYMLPTHLLGEGTNEAPLHCMLCGHPHETAAPAAEG
jgi:prepilin-type N-terminal cleavage/methylation domain-containing protein